MNVMPATRNPNDTGFGLSQTEFQIHIMHRISLKENLKHLIDFTEHKLIKYSMNIFGVDRLNVMALIMDYRDGKVAVCWKRGKPHYIHVKRESTGKPI